MLILVCVAALFCFPSSGYKTMERPLCLKPALFFPLVMQKALHLLLSYITLLALYNGISVHVSFKPLIKMEARPCRIFYQQHILPAFDSKSIVHQLPY